MKKQIKTKIKCFVYKSVPSALLPVPHSDELAVDELHLGSISQHLDVTTCFETQAIGGDYSVDKATPSQILMSQEHLHALART